MERIHYDLSLKGDLSDAKKHNYAKVRSEKDVLFSRYRSKKGGDTRRRAFRAWLNTIGWLVGPRSAASFCYKTYLDSDKTNGCSKEEVIKYLKEMNVSDSDIKELVSEAEQSVKQNTKGVEKNARN